MDLETIDAKFEIRLMFFGAVADIVGSRSLSHPLVSKTTSTDVLAQVVGRFPNLAGQKLLFAINQEYATGDEIIRDGDEVAIFTAVSGG